MTISKEEHKPYNDKFIAKVAESIGISPFNNPESWGDDPDNDFENNVLKHTFDKNNTDDVKQYHDYFGMGIGRNGPWQPLEDDEIVEYLKNNPKEIENWVDDVDWDDERDGSKFVDSENPDTNDNGELDYDEGFEAAKKSDDPTAPAGKSDRYYDGWNDGLFDKNNTKVGDIAKSITQNDLGRSI